VNPSDDIVLFGVASSGVVEQWDGHPTTLGILLRWFARPDLGYPDLGFEVSRATVPDIPPLPFDDLNVPLVEGKTSWTYADRITLSAAAGLHFEPSTQVGWWRLVIVPGAPVTVSFTSPAWLVAVLADAGTSDLLVRGFVNQAVVREETLVFPGQRLEWRSRGVESLELSGTGTVYLIGFHLLDDALAWTPLAHRCLPVIDPGYACGPQPGGTEADEARSRLPAAVAADWAARFDASFTALLPALHRLATKAPPAPVPTATGRPDVKLAAGERDVIRLSSLDPHGARILGLAYDDPLGGALDGREYAYKVVGRWLGQTVEIDFDPPPDPRQLQRDYGLTFRPPRGGIRGGQWSFRFDRAVRELSLELHALTPVTWSATTAAGATASGTVAGDDVLSLPDAIELTLSAAAPRDVRLGRARWTPVLERFGLLPGIVAVEPGPPPGPATITATVTPAASPSAIATADLDWPVAIAADGSTPEGAPISYQVAHLRLTPDPQAAAPAPGAQVRKDLIQDGAPAFVSADRALAPPGTRVLYTDRNEGAGLGPGWWGWWVRGVDLFGRVSAPSGWELAAVRDTAPPPSPVMVQAEWVQRALPATTVAVLGRSTEAKRWLATSAAPAGLVASWAYGPEETAVRPDVDGFELFVRRAATVPGAAADDPLVYPAWPAPVARYGPTAIREVGVLTGAPAADPVLTVTVSGVQPLPPAPNAKPNDPVRSAVATDLELDGAAGAFVGGTLDLDGTSFPVVASGDGPELGLFVQHAAGAGPTAGAGRLRAPAGVLVRVPTDVPALAPATGLRVRSGVLTAGAAGARLPVLRRDGGDFLCFALGAAGAAGVGDEAAWYPVWSVALNDTGFGPAPSATVPVANAQVAVRAVRDIAGSALFSARSASLTVTAVDLTPPVTPAVTAVAFDPGAPCARLASRADWYGRSYFTLSWGAQADRGFIVYRALGDEIARLDRLELGQGGRRATGFPHSADYPPGVEADATRRARVLAELAAIDSARAMAAGDARASALEAAYEALTADTQMLLARQDYAWAAYAPVFPEPVTAATWQDTLDGRSHGHWFYRVTSRTAAGIESAPSEPTPPVCCPDVVPPAVPLAHMALADDNAVKLRWLASPDRDLDHYDIYAAREAAAVAELATMTPVESWSPASRAGGVVLERSVARDPGEWCFWIVAVDDSGNRSSPSAMLKGRALRPPPQPPVWVSAERTPAGAPDRVTLTWTHPSDQRLTCLVERRATGGPWSAVSTWLPRGEYTFGDAPPDLAATWEYRIRVRDHQGQTASSMPTRTLPSAP
jgi:hypothetical protein